MMASLFFFGPHLYACHCWRSCLSGILYSRKLVFVRPSAAYLNRILLKSWLYVTVETAISLLKTRNLSLAAIRDRHPRNSSVVYALWCSSVDLTIASIAIADFRGSEVLCNLRWKWKLAFFTARRLCHVSLHLDQLNGLPIGKRYSSV